MNDALLNLTVSEMARQPRLAEALIALNNENVSALSWLDGDRLRHLVAEAFSARAIGKAEALLISFDQGADYDSPNYLWFRSRFERFVYVDRIVVSSAARGRGHARRLYLDLFDRARDAGHDKIVCEVNSNPPNPTSDAFHAALGFTGVGSGSPYGGTKTVRYLMHGLAR